MNVKARTIQIFLKNKAIEIGKGLLVVGAFIGCMALFLALIIGVCLLVEKFPMFCFWTKEIGWTIIKCVIALFASCLFLAWIDDNWVKAKRQAEFEIKLKETLVQQRNSNEL